MTVHTRVRPLVERETRSKAQPVSWRITRSAILVDDGLRKRPWSFDRVFAPGDGNAGVYQEVARPIVRRALRGYNGTVFCYGQTGSGKTYSMVGTMGGGAAARLETEGGDVSSSGDGDGGGGAAGGGATDSRGMLQRAVAEVYDHVEGERARARRLAARAQRALEARQGSGGQKGGTAGSGRAGSRSRASTEPSVHSSSQLGSPESESKAGAGSSGGSSPQSTGAGRA